MKCPNCQFDNPAEMKFCGNCGTRLGATGLLPQDERKIVTVLFGDVSGFTAMSENLDPEAVKEIMNDCLSTLAEVVRSFDGTVDKFGGDSILAYFGYPVAHEDDPERAVRAGLAMQERMAAFSDELTQQRGLRLRMRVGLNTGLVLAGQMGASGSHQESTVMGDTVNTASRLQTLAPPSKVVVSQSTYRATRHSFEYGPMQSASVKGKVEPVVFYEVIGIRSERESVRGLDSYGLRAPLIGRAAELQQLQQAYAQAVSGRIPMLAVVWGAAGSGKSRLIAEFGADLSQDQASPAILRGRCLPFGGNTYSPLGEMVKHECGISDSDALTEVQSKLRAGIEKLLEQAEGHAHPNETFRIAAHIGATLGWDFANAHLEELSEASRREERAWAWRRFFSLKATTAPLVLFFEDIHWADSELLKYIEQMVARIENAPILVICASRPELREQNPDWPAECNTISVELRPLTGEEGAMLINSLLEVEQLPASVRDLIVQRADGTPFYIEEIIRLLIEDGMIREQDGRWLADPEIEQHIFATESIPANVAALLTARIDRLIPIEQKRVLQEAAVIGYEFWHGAVVSILEGQLPADSIAHYLRGLVQREMVVPQPRSAFVGEDEYSFRHILTHDVAYATLPYRERSDKHRRAAKWLEQAAGDRLEEYVERIAYHYQQALELTNKASIGSASQQASTELQAKTRYYLKLAGDKTSRLQNYPRAEEFYRTAMGIPPSDAEDNQFRLTLNISYAKIRSFLGDYSEAELYLQGAASDARRFGIKSMFADAMAQLIEVYRERGKYEQAIYLGEELKDVQQDLGNIEGDALATAQLALSYLYQRQTDKAATLAEQAYKSAHMGKSRTGQMYAMQVLSIIYSDVRGDLHSAELINRRLLVMLEEIGDRLLISNTFLNLAIICYYLQKYEDSVSLSQQAIDKARELGYTNVDMRASNILAHTLLALNQPAEAMTHLLHALEISAKLDERDVLPEIRRGLAEAHLALGELDVALEQAEIATAVVLPEDVYSQATTQRTLGLVLAANGRGEEAEVAFRRSLTLLEDTAYLPVLVATCERYADFLEKSGRVDEAIPPRARAVELRQRISTPQPETEDVASLLNIAPGNESDVAVQV